MGSVNGRYHYYCNYYYYLNIIRITTLPPLDSMPRLLPEGRLCLLFTGMQEEVDLLTLGLAPGCVKWELVMASFTIWEHSHLSHLLREAQSQPVNCPFPKPGLCSGEESTLKALQRPAHNGSVTSLRKPVAAALLLKARRNLCQPQPCFLRWVLPGTLPCLFSARAFNPKQQDCLFAKRPRTFKKTALWKGLSGVPGPWLELLSGFINEAFILIGRL